RFEMLDITDGHCLDVRTFFRGGMVFGERGRGLDRTEGARCVGRGHAAVDVRPPGPRLAPVTDGAFGIAALRLAEGPARLGPREGIHQLNALVEVRARVRVR